MSEYKVQCCESNNDVLSCIYDPHGNAMTYGELVTRINVLQAENEDRKREMQILSDTIESIEVFCTASNDRTFAVDESLKAIGHVEWLKSRPDIHTDTETLLNMADENDRLRAALRDIIERRRFFECQSLDYIQGYRHGQMYLQNLAREALNDED